MFTGVGPGRESSLQLNVRLDAASTDPVDRGGNTRLCPDSIQIMSCIAQYHRFASWVFGPSHGRRVMSRAGTVNNTGCFMLAALRAEIRSETCRSPNRAAIDMSDGRV